MKVLVTGATGAVGRHLVRRLVETGDAVRGLARPTSDTSMLKNVAVEWVHGDITEPESLMRAIDGCTQVYHCAALVSRMRLSRSDYHAVNVAGTENVARAALQAGVQRLVHIGTAGNFHNPDHRPVDESATPQPNTDYRVTKLAAEGVMNSYFRDHRLPVVIARISSVYGPEQRNWLDLFRAIQSGRFRMLGNGATRKHMGYISDVIDGLLRCGRTPGIEGQAYFIASPEPVTIAQLTETIARALSARLSKGHTPAWPFRIYFSANEFTFARLGRELPHAHRYSIFFEDQALDLTKAKTQLGFQPVVSIAEGIQRTLEWYRSVGYL